MELDWQVAMQPSKRRKLDSGSGAALVEKAKESIRAKVKHPFLIVKRLLGYGKVRYRRLAKNPGANGGAAGVGQSADSRVLPDLMRGQ